MAIFDLDQLDNRKKKITLEAQLIQTAATAGNVTLADFSYLWQAADNLTDVQITSRRQEATNH